MKALALLFLLFTQLCLAQDYQFRMDGSFSVPTDAITPTPVNFTIRWNETNNKLQGIYSDNYYADSAPLTGDSQTSGRVIQIIFPEVRRGAKSLRMLLTEIGLTTGSATVNLSGHDEAGVSLFSALISGIITMNTSVNPAPENQPCSVGFGDLTGYCGIYGGTINKTEDSNLRCRSIASPYTRLELGADAEISLYLGYEESTAGLPRHRIGSLANGPLTTEINFNTRNCGPLPGTTMEPGNCQRLNLVGSFSTIAGDQLFSGTYTITDEENEDTCVFTLNLSKEN